MTDDLTRLAVDLEASGHRAYLAAKVVVGSSAWAVQREWRSRWAGFAAAPHLAAAVTHDTRDGFTGPSAEIGPDKDKPQGALGNLLEFGSTKNAPQPGGAPALDLEGPRFERALGDAAARLL